jgi:hypothetical protein
VITPYRHFALFMTALVLRNIATMSAADARQVHLTSECYHLTYSDTSGALLADYVALDLNPDREARSGVASGTRDDFWRMFLVGAKWERSRDTLHLHFTNGFSTVEYTLHGLPGRVHRGIAQVHYDFVGAGVPTKRVTATPIRCDSARLQSPRVTSKARVARREDERRRSFVAAETARLAAEPSPLAGTYRFELRLPSLSHPIIVFGRTERAPDGAFWGLTGDDAFEPAGRALTPALGYRLRLSVSLDSTTASFSNGELAYFDVVSKPKHTPDGLTLWRGQTDVLFAVSRLVSEDPLDSLLSQASRAVSSVWFDGERGQTVGGWMVGANDRVDFSMRVERKGQPVLSIRGMRLSTTTAPLKE